MHPGNRDTYEHGRATARAQLGEEAFATIWAQGRTTSLEQTLAALPHIFSLVEDAAILRHQQSLQPGHAFRIEIDARQVAPQVAEITQTDYFQQLLQQVQRLRPDPG